MRKGQTKAAITARAIAEHRGDRITTERVDDGGWLARVWKGKKLKAGAWARTTEMAAICALIEVP